MNITLMVIISWLLFGLIVGSVVHVLDPGSVKGGIIGTIITGILGAVIGEILGSSLLNVYITGFDLQSILLAVLGALILSFLERLIFRDRDKIKTNATRLQ